MGHYARARGLQADARVCPRTFARIHGHSRGCNGYSRGSTDHRGCSRTSSRGCKIDSRGCKIDPGTSTTSSGGCKLDPRGCKLDSRGCKIDSRGSWNASAQVELEGYQTVTDQPIVRFHVL